MQIKILITYKENYQKISNTILTPIQVGRSISDIVFDDMIGDDTGDNISAENNKYSELTAQYWAWKNYDKIGDPDYIGHMQYRRHFIFNQNAKFKLHTPINQEKGFSVKFVEQLDNEYIENIGLDEKSISSAITGYDIVVVKKSDMNYINCKNAKEDYLKHVPGAQETDYNILMKTLLQLYPSYKDIVDDFEKKPYRHFYHMFVMKKELFFEYNNFVFPILSQIDNLIDYSNRGTRGGRVLGYLGEMLFCLFIFKKQKEGYIIKELFSTIILNNKKNIKTINQCIDVKNDFCIVYDVVSNKNIYQFIASIRSLDLQIKNDRDYDVIVFYNDLDEKYCYQLKILQLKNFNIQLINALSSDIKENIIAQLQFLQRYKNIVFLSPNILFNNTISFSPYLNKKIAMPKDPQISFKINHDQNIAAFIENVVGLKDPYKYASDAIVLINNRKINLTLLKNKIKSMPFYINKKNDIFNYLFKEEIVFLPDEYLFEYSEIERKKYFSEYEFFKAYQNSISSYFAKETPSWIICKYIKQTPFYDEFLNSVIDVKIFRSNRIINNDVSSLLLGTNGDISLIYVLNNFLYFRIKKIWYKLKKSVTFGKYHQKYKDKYKKIKQLIKDTKKLKKQILK